METMRKISKRYYLRKMVIWVLVNLMFFGVPFGAFAITGDDVIRGTADVTYDGVINPDVFIDMGSPSAVINWANFDTVKNQNVEFDRGSEGGMNFAVLNRITGPGGATSFCGNLYGNNGLVIVSNPSGIIFGGSAFVQARSFAAIGRDIDPDVFMAGGLNFDPLDFDYSDLTGDIELGAYWVGGMGGHWQQAEIHVDETLALIGKNILNKGKIYTDQPGAYVVMAAGESVLIGRENGKVMVDVSAPTPEDCVVDNGDTGFMGYRPGPGSIEADGGHVVLAAGDIYSTAIEGVETLRATAEGSATFYGPISAYAETASDAVAEVEITTGGSLTINQDIKVTAVGLDNNPADGVADGDTYASIKLKSGGDLTINSNTGSGGTELLATAIDGVNNNADISLEAAGLVKVDAPDQVTIQAEAGSGKLPGAENQANVNIKGGSVSITATDLGISDRPAAVSAYAHDATVNRAKVDIQSEGDVEIIGAGSNGDSAIVEALAQCGSENHADVVINAGGDVDIIAKQGEPTQGSETTSALVIAEARDADISNEANVDIDAGGNVHVKSEGGNLHVVQEAYYEIYTNLYGGGWRWVEVDHVPGWYHGPVKTHPEETGFTPAVASVKAIAENASNSNTAGVDITAGGNAVVLAKDGGEAKVLAYTGNALDSVNTSSVNITAEDGYVLVHGIGGAESTEEGFTESEASVKAIAKNAGGGEDGTNSANITLVAKDFVEEPADTDFDSDGDADADADIDTTFLTRVSDEDDDADNDCDFFAGDVMVVGAHGGKAEVKAIAKEGSENTAAVDVDADSDVMVIAMCDDQPSEAEILALAKNGYQNNANVSLGGVGHKIGGDVLVLGKEGGEAEIKAKAEEGHSNTADVLICTEGELDVIGTCGGDAEVKAEAQKGEFNKASVGIGAVEGIKVMAMGPDSDASIEAKAQKGYSNEADLIACTQGDLWVLGMNGGEAEIATEATRGQIVDAYTATCAAGDIIVSAADFGRGPQSFVQGDSFGGCCSSSSAKISSKAESKGCSEEASASAETHVVSKEGGVAVMASGGCMGPKVEAGITSKASGGVFNRAYTGVAAKGEPVSLPPMLEPTDVQQSLSSGYGPGLMPGSVLVMGAFGGEAKISSGAFGREAVKNDAMTVICATDNILVTGFAGGEAKVSSMAFGADENIAQTKVFADRIGVHGNAALKAMTPGNYVSLSDLCITPEGKVAYNGEGDGSALIVVGTYASREDCPDCPPCPCEEQPGGLAAAAALAPEVHPQPQDCPMLIEAATAELTGAAEAEAIDIVMENALAINPDINPCQACAKLLNSAAVLADPDGSRMAALAAVVSSAVAPDQPFDPAAELMIATAIAENVDNPENPDYAFAGEFVDALVNYVAAASELGIPAEDGRELVMAKYGAALDAPENANVRAYVEARLAAMQ